ncbi:MAG: hypothetical protein RMJ36_06190 [Candidatus Calescibacterium sp.]|nr:hypothetical protein [Candidatus Calescibacterium sp.]MDW8133225.1 hypothetical protein [Candidatus Calescibacterium sp.]
MRLVSVFISFSFLLLIANANKYFLYIFNIPIDYSLFVVENNNVWVDQKVIDIIKKRVDIKVDIRHFDKSKAKYLLNGICSDNNDKLVFRKNSETNIIDVNTLKAYNEVKDERYKKGDYSVNQDQTLYKIIETKYFKLYYTNRQLGLILSGLLDSYYENIMNFFGFRYGEILNLGYKVPIYLAPTDDVYRSYNLVPDWSSGSLVFDFWGPTPSFVIYAHERDSFLIQRVLPHEITHLIIALYWKENALDQRTKFIQEGIAQYIEYRLLTGLEEIVVHPSIKIRFENLLYPTLDSKDSIKVFYENSLAFTSFLICRYGKFRYLQFIRKNRDSLDIIRNLNDVYQFTNFYDHHKVIKEIEDDWNYFIKTSNPTTLK